MSKYKSVGKPKRKFASGGALDYSPNYMDDDQGYESLPDNSMEDDEGIEPIPNDLMDDDDRFAGMGAQPSGGYTSANLGQNQSTLNAFSSVQAKQQNALQALKDAQARAMAALQPKQDKSAMWLAIAQGLLSPTRTGGFAESLGNAAGSAAPYAQHYADADVAAKQQISQMDYGLAQALYTDAMKNPQIIDWYARGPGGVVGKQKALIVDGQPVPFGEILQPGGSHGNSMQDKLDLFMDPKYGPIMQKYLQMNHPPSQSVTNVQNSVPYESQDQKNAADVKKGMAEEAYKSLGLANQLNAVLPEIKKTPDAYFGPGGPGMVWAGKALKQLGIDVGDGLDSASFVSAIMSHLGPAQRIVGSGSSSDRDVALFMNSLPGLTQTKEGNIALVKYYNKMAQYNRKLVKIMTAAAGRGDFYGMDDQAQAEINKLGRIFTDDEVADLQRLSGVAPQTQKKKLPKGGAPVNIQEDNDTLTIGPGSNP